jgi:hypothetical protein
LNVNASPILNWPEAQIQKRPPAGIEKVKSQLIVAATREAAMAAFAQSWRLE